jgi:hypothetical protein
MFTASADFRTPALTINGVTYTFDNQAARGIWFDGQAGSDTALLIGTRDSDSVVLRVGSADLSGPGYRLAAGAEKITVRSGGGVDSAVFHDSTGDDRFQAGPRWATLSGSGFVNRVQGFRTIAAYATTGNDTALLGDSEGDDTLAALPPWSRLWGSGFSIRVEHFDAVHAVSTGGRDTARLYDSPGDDVLIRSADEVSLSGADFANRAKGFANVRAIGHKGVDRVYQRGSPSGGRFQAVGSFAHAMSDRTDAVIRDLVLLESAARHTRALPEPAAVDRVLATL